MTASKPMTITWHQLRGSAPSPTVERRRRLRVLQWLSLILLIGVAPSTADWRSDFVQAVERLESGDASAAAGLLRRAIGERGSESSEMVEVGDDSVPYLPHFYLGVALDRTGDCRGALAAWRTSADQGQVRNHRSAYTELQDGIAKCTSASDSDPALRQARIDADRAISDAQSKLSAVSRTLAAVEPGRRSRALNRAAGDIESIGQRVEQAKGEQEAADRGRTEDRLGSYTRARRLASDAADELAILSPEIDSQIARLPQPAATTPRATPQTSSPTSQIADGETAEPETRSGREQGEPSDSASGSRNQGATESAEIDLEAAATAFVGGDYDRAVELLSGAENASDQEFQARVIRAAARFALWVRGAESSTELQSAAAADVARCAELRPGFVFDERLFSPRFIRFYSENS